MEVKVIDYTKDAIEKLIFTKNTRLQGEHTLEQIKKWPYDQKLKELDYMFNTIQSSFEFVNFTFLISGVTRNFTHQLVRTRNASYAQESLRAVDASGRECSDEDPLIDIMLAESMNNYSELLSKGYQIQDARKVLPSAVKTSIITQLSLREIAHMAETRLCFRTAGEYQEVFKLMKLEVTILYPEFERMIRVACAKTGICAFPNYKDCPIQEHTVKVTNQQKDAIQYLWQSTTHEADPGIYK